MSYRLKRFVGDLPQYNAIHEITVGPVAPAYLATVGRGYFDADGAGDAPMALRTVTLEAEMHATTVQALHEQMRVWDSLVGARRKLWREEIASGQLQWGWARLEAFEKVREWIHLFWMPVTFRWSILPPAIWNGALAAGMHHWDGEGQWNSSGWKFNDSVGLGTLDTNPQTLTVTNQGTATVDNAVVRVTAGAAPPITQVRVACNNEQAWRVDCEIYSGQAVVVDCGAKTVRVNGTPAFSSFTREPYHKTPQWLRLKPGNNEITVTLSGGGSVSTVAIEFYHGYR